ncbi:MAG: hypothetical protein RJA98_1858 [Pseudomonadota bacterium]|jgi:hypothetical protein
MDVSVGRSVGRTPEPTPSAQAALGRRALLATLAAWGCAPGLASAATRTAVSPPTHADDPGAAHEGHAHGPTAPAGLDTALRERLLAEGEAALLAGNPRAAGDAFQTAAMMLHAADSEMGLARAAAQDGGFQRALVMASHTAGAHRDTPGAAALYAWMLAASGQQPYADRMLAETLLRVPGHPLLLSTREALAASWPALPSPALLATPHRVAPQAVALDGQLPPATAQGHGTGVLLASGTQALVPWLHSEAPAATAALWVRNGLGESVRAQWRHWAPTLGLALLDLPHALPASAAALLAPSDAFAGSAGHVLQLPPAAPAVPAWPTLFQGFIGGPLAASSAWRGLLFELPAATQGAPLWDASARCTGMVVQRGTTPAGWWPLSALTAVFGDALRAAPLAPGTPAPRRGAPADVHERAMPSVLQLLSA